MSESPSRLIRISDTKNSSAPHKKISAQQPPVRIFQKEWMEAFTLISFKQFLVYVGIYEAILSFIIFYEKFSFSKSVFFASLGFSTWFLFEYFLHRFIFHFISNNKSIQRLIYIFHGNHHVQPNHPYRTLMPIIVTLPISLITWSVSFYIFGFESGTTFFAGFFTGYIMYDIIHYATHNFSMRKFPLNVWKRHHLLHHYRTEEHNYSISLPFLDILFMTKYKKIRK